MPHARPTTYWHRLQRWHHAAFSRLERRLDGWFLGLAARLVFSSVLMVFFLTSAATKLGDGVFGVFTPSIGAYAQIVPPIAEAAGYDVSQISLLPWGLIVRLGTWAEILLPILLLLGLATRLSALALVGFITVMTYVDIRYHGVDSQTIGAFFDPVHNAAILDQRLLWLFPLIVLILKGPGKISLDHAASRLLSPTQRQQEAKQALRA